MTNKCALDDGKNEGGKNIKGDVTNGTATCDVFYLPQINVKF
jgi:hypothetical protein